MIKKIFIATVFALTIVSGLDAAQFLIDQTYSNIHFKIPHLMGTQVGRFTKVSGTIELNKDNTDLAALAGTIDMTGIDTNNEERDKDLQSERFFDAAKYPTAEFASTKIEKDKVYLNFTLHGVTKTVPLEYTFRGMAQDQYGRTKTAISLKGRLNRKDFGITYNVQTDDGKWLLGDEVEFMIEFEGLLVRK
jgi:polyisoprenoid-binding protein YceI